ncbi:hypothetical protein DU490_10910 [Halomonas sp. DQ26W]|uniref:IS66 family insertion sequence element accessory protein TnpA n=1 Tax=Halomonas sp. DQ26W TaxID=2282311 RepID=UPI000DF78F7E|nr:hypothetical protein DU490_10910 [Halomonas sp. DQ26W]
MPTRRHPRYPAEQWQAWIEEQDGSGLSQRVFCEQKGLSKSSFQLWKRRLKRVGQRLRLHLGLSMPRLASSRR